MSKLAKGELVNYLKPICCFCICFVWRAKKGGCGGPGLQNLQNKLNPCLLASDSSHVHSRKKRANTHLSVGKRRQGAQNRAYLISFLMNILNISEYE
jgi:hypothetical protein